MVDQPLGLLICAAWEREAPSCRRKAPESGLTRTEFFDCFAAALVDPASKSAGAIRRTMSGISPARVTTSVLDRQTRRGDPVRRIGAGRPDQHLCRLDFFGHRATAGDDNLHSTVYMLLRSMCVAEKGGRRSELSVAVIRGYRNS
jgi:hypothetical protein